MSEQPKWLEKAKETYKYHRSKMLLDDNHNITKTAKYLRRSFGSVAEDLMIAKWLRTHEKQMEKFEHAYQVLEFIREKKKEQDLDEIEY